MTAEPDLYQVRLGETCLHLRVALDDLRGALRRFNARAEGKVLGPDGGLSQALADANRALARAEALLHEQERLARQDVCPRCQGEGRVAERGVLLRRVRCPGCGGTGRVTAPRPRGRAPAGARGRWQRLILTRLLALGGASWPVPLRRLWGEHAPQPRRPGRPLPRPGGLGAPRPAAPLPPPGPHPRSPVPRATRARLTARGAECAEALTNAPKR